MDDKTSIDRRIKEILSNVEAKDSGVQRMLGIIEEFCLRDGKRIRPKLSLLAYRGYGGTVTNSMLTVAAVLEMLHAFLLVHDDIMDQSMLRRGKPTVHARYAHEYETLSGEHMAMLAGDTLLFVAYEALLSTDFSSELVQTLSKRITRVLIDTCYGQVIDYEKAQPVTKERVIEMYRLKTSVYSIEGPLHCGALLAEAPEEDLASLSAYAEPLGIAFQIQDDLLDVFPQAETGKPRFGDLREGKQTLLVWYVLTHGTEEQVAHFGKLLGTDFSLEDGQWLADIIEYSGARRYAEDMVDELYTQAIDNARRIPQLQKDLVSFAQEIMRRKN
ncbi:MAG: polyprenyl synthetase family protein [Nanobdellota archaeon]